MWCINNRFQNAEIALWKTYLHHFSQYKTKLGLPTRDDESLWGEQMGAEVLLTAPQETSGVLRNHVSYYNSKWRKVLYDNSLSGLFYFSFSNVFNNTNAFHSNSWNYSVLLGISCWTPTWSWVKRTINISI